MSGAAGRAFARVKTMMAMVAAIVNQGLQPLAQQLALQDLGLEYKSRGKGRNRWGGHKYTARIGRSSTLHAQNGARECARRRRHIGEGRYRGTPVFFPTARG